jgi:hypothetical protein
MKIYATAAVEALRRKERGGQKQDETQFTTKKNGAFLVSPLLNSFLLFFGISPGFWTKHRVPVLCFRKTLIENKF